MNRTKLRIAALLLAVVGAVATLTGCSASTRTVAYPTPSVWTVSYLGDLYCPYEYSPYEVDMYGYTGPCTRVPFPSITAAPAAGTLNAALAVYWTTYSSFFEGGGYWYDQYYAPIGPRYHVTVIARTSYLNNASTFQHTYAGQVKTNSAKAKYSNGKTGNYTFPTSNAKAKNKPITNVGTTGKNSKTTSNVGTDNSNTGGARSTGTSSGKTGSTRSGTSGSGSSSGKSGSSRSGSTGGRR